MNPLSLDPNQNYPIEPATVATPEWRKGLGAFVDETQALGYGLKALGAQAFGMTDTRDQALQDYQRNMQESTAGWQAPAVPQIEDIRPTESDGISRLGSYLEYQVPKGIAQLGALVVGGLGTGAVAKTIASTGIKELAKTEMKNLVLDAVGKSAVGMAAVPLVEREAGKIAIKQLAERQLLGTEVGVAVGGLGMETGQTYGQFANDPTIGPKKAVLPAVAYGGIAGMLEYLPIHAGMQAVGLDRMLLRNVIKDTPELAAKAVELSMKQRALQTAGKIAGTGLIGGAAEGIIEGLQALAQNAAERYAKEDPTWADVVPRTPEEWSNVWNQAAPAFATGMVAGAALGPMTGRKHPVTQPVGKVNVPQAETEAPAGAGVAQDTQQPQGQAPAEETPPAPGITSSTIEAEPNQLPVEQVPVTERLPEETDQQYMERLVATPVAPTEEPTDAVFPSPEASAAAPEEAAAATEQLPSEPIGGEVQAVSQPDGSWSVVAPDKLIARDVTEQEATALRDQEIAKEAQRGDVVKTTTSPQLALQGQPAVLEPATQPEQPNGLQERQGQGQTPTEVVQQDSTQSMGAETTDVERQAIWDETAARSILKEQGIAEAGDDVNGQMPTVDAVATAVNAVGEDAFRARAADIEAVHAQQEIPTAQQDQLLTDSTQAVQQQEAPVARTIKDPPYRVARTGLWNVTLEGEDSERPARWVNKTGIEQIVQNHLNDEIPARLRSPDGDVVGDIESLPLTANSSMKEREAVAKVLETKAGQLYPSRNNNAVTDADRRTAQALRNPQFAIELLPKAEAAALPSTITEPSNAQQVTSASPVYENVQRPGEQGGQEVQVPAQEGSQGVLPSGQESRQTSVAPLDRLESRTPEVDLDPIRRAVSPFEVSDTAQEPGYAYHATNQENAQAIRESGALTPFEPSYGTDQEAWPDGSTDPRSYWSDNVKTVSSFAPAEGTPVVLRAKKSEVFGKEAYTGDVFNAKDVPAAELEVLTDKGWEPLTQPAAISSQDMAEQSRPNVLESRTSTPMQPTTDFVSQADSTLGKGWTQRAIDAGILQVNETSPANSASGHFEPSTGKFVVNLDRTPQEQSPVAVLLHEGSHASMARMLGGQFNSFHKDLERLAKQGSATAQSAILQATQGAIENINRHGAEQLQHRIGDMELPTAKRSAELQRVRALVEKQHPGLLAEEDFAYYIQLASSEKPAEAGYWRRLLTAIQAWTAQTNFGKAMATVGWRPELSPQLSVELAKQAAQTTLRRAKLVNTLVGERAKELRGSPTAAQAGVLEANVWHAGPNTWAPEPGFPRGRPRLDKVGTGEGGQLFGWGWYSAENKEVSGPKGRYAKTFSKYAQRDNPILYKGKPIEEYKGPLRLVLDAYQDLGIKDRLKALEILQTNRDVAEASFFAKDPLVDFGEISPELERYDEAFKLFEQVDPNDLQMPIAFVARLDLPDANIQRMIQWEKPLSEQTPQVRAALINATGALGSRVRALAKDPNVTAEGLYNGIMYELPPVSGEHPKKKVSEYLRSLGIVGNKYLDYGSRSPTESPTYNYVVWDQDVLDRVGQQHLDWQTGERLESRLSPSDLYQSASDYFLGSKPGELGAARHARMWLQDKLLPQKLKEKELGVAPQDSVYEAMNKVKSKIMNREKVLDREYVNPMMKIAADSNFTIPQLDKVAYARTAQETNERGRRLTAKLWLKQFLDSMSDAGQRKLLRDEMKAARAASQVQYTMKDGTIGTRTNKLALQNAYYNIAATWSARDAVRDAQLKQGGYSNLNATSIRQDLLARFSDFAEKPSGMTDADARVELAKWAHNPEMQKLFAIFDAMNRQSLAERLNHGLLTQEMHDRWFAAHDHYATLNREGYEESHGGKSHGIGAPAKLREFSPKLAVNVFSNTVGTAKRAIAQGENNDAMLMLKRMIEAHPEPDFWKVIKQEHVKHIDADGFLEEGLTKQLSDRDVSFIDNGDRWIIQAKPDNEQAMSILAAMKNTDSPTLGPVLRTFAKATRLVAQLNTSLSPEFFFVNPIRDLLEASVNMSDSEATQVRGKIVKGIPEAAKALRDIYRGRTANKDMTQHPLHNWVQRYEEAGVPSGWMSYYEHATEQAKELEHQITVLSSKPSFRKYGHLAAAFVEDYNSMAENAIRLSTFKALVEKGVHESRAATIAKDLTVNFDRKGSAGTAINSLYMFANAGIQGSARMLHAMTTSRTVQKVALGIIVASILADQFNASDDDKWDKIPENVKRRNLIFRNPTGVGPDFIMLPAPWGYNLLWRFGQQISMAMRQPRGWTASGAATDLTQTALDAFNPIGGGTLVQTLTPSLLRPAVMIAENKDWTGERTLRPTLFPGEVKPDSQLYWATTSAASKAIAEHLNSLFGGDKVTSSGWTDISPTSIDAWASQIFGAAGKTLGDFAKIPFDATDPTKDFEVRRLPVIRKFTTAPSSAIGSAMYHDRVSQIVGLEHRLKEYTEGPNADSAKARALRAENSAVLTLVPYAKDSEKQLKSLRQQIALASAQDRTSQVKELRDRMKLLMVRFNSSFERRVQ